MRQLHVRLSESWTRSLESASYVRGSAFRDGALLREQQLLEHFGNVHAPEQLRRALTGLNGFFGVAKEGPSHFAAAVDRLRSIPLFYGTAREALYVSDDADWIRAKVGDTYRDPTAEREFLLTGYVTGTETLYPNVRQLQAGEYLYALEVDGRLEHHVGRYFRFERQEEPPAPEAPLEELHNVMVASVDRLIKWANGRTIVVPLSGGYDSRIIATLLKQAGYPKVITFTYGRPGNPEAQVSQGVAEGLGFEWHFVPYSNEKWRDWFQTEEREHYYHFAHQNVSIPHLQDWPAVWALTKEGTVPQKSVFVPGHTGDFIAGGHILKQFVGSKQVSPRQAATGIHTRHYNLWLSESETEQEALVKRIIGRLGVDASTKLSGTQAINAHDTWNWQERQAKFIVNSLRVYEFWGHDWWMPLWDAEMIAFWERVPLSNRLDTALLRAYVDQQYAASTSNYVSVANPEPSDGLAARIKESVKSGPIAPLLKELQRLLNLRREYHSHPLAWYGILDEESFRTLYSGRENINSFIGRLLLTSNEGSEVHELGHRG